jgi:hypothetical protein
MHMQGAGNLPVSDTHPKDPRGKPEASVPHAPASHSMAAPLATFGGVGCGDPEVKLAIRTPGCCQGTRRNANSTFPIVWLAPSW